MGNGRASLQAHASNSRYENDLFIKRLLTFKGAHAEISSTCNDICEYKLLFVCQQSRSTLYFIRHIPRTTLDCFIHVSFVGLVRVRILSRSVFSSDALSQELYVRRQLSNTYNVKHNVKLFDKISYQIK